MGLISGFLRVLLDVWLTLHRDVCWNVCLMGQHEQGGLVVQSRRGYASKGAYDPADFQHLEFYI